MEPESMHKRDFVISYLRQSNMDWSQVWIRGPYRSYSLDDDLLCAYISYMIHPLPLNRAHQLLSLWCSTAS